MARFSDEKRTYVRRELLETGRELFARYGLRKTTISDLTQAVDIADGTFYQFFDSKERLYLEILRQERADFGDRASAVLADAEDPEQAIVRYLELVTDEIESNPLVQQLVVDDRERLVGQLSDEEQARQREQELGHLLPYLEQWHENGRLVDDDLEVIAESINAAALVALHSDDIEGDYGVVRDRLIRSVAAGLTTEPSADE